MKAIFKREFKSYFTSPLGFFVMAVYFFFLGLFFYFSYSNGSSDNEAILISMILIVMFTVPVITMRSFSDDRKQKVDQVLFTSPVRLWSIVLGKFFAAMCMFALCFSPSIIFEIIILSYVKVPIITYLYALFGVLLLGGALISIGMFISSLTESVALSAVISLIIDIVVLYANGLAILFNADKLLKITEKVSFLDIAENFANPVFSIPDVVFFLSIIAAFLFLSERSLDKRRWS